MKKIFISYTSASPDSNIALDFYYFFKNNGLTPFLSDKSIELGEIWSQRIMEELEACDYFFILLSANSIMSDMVTEELRRAKDLFNKRAKPIILPVRLKLGYDEVFNYEISGYLNRVQQKHWNGDEDTDKLGNEVLKIINNKRNNLLETDTTPDLQASGLNLLPPDNAPLKTPNGSVALNSPYYIARKGEESFVQQILWTGSLLKIKAPRKFGKSSLLIRVNRFAQNNNHKVISINFKDFSTETKRNLNSLLIQICNRMARDMRLPNKVKEYWADDWIDIKMICRTYIEDEILAKSEQPVVLSLDEVDQIFEYPDVSNEFFSLLRNFHEESKVADEWEKLKIVITHASDTNFAVTNLNQSPFNVGTEICLSEFTLDQVYQLVNRMELDLSMEQVQNLIDKIGAHPYLIRLALYELKIGRYTYDSLLHSSINDDELFEDHLRYLYFKITQSPKLLETFKRVLKSIPIDDEYSYIALKASGLIKGSMSNAVISFNIYKDYFAAKLKV